MSETRRSARLGLKGVLLLLCLLFVFSFSAQASLKAAKIQAAMIFDLLGYVTWLNSKYSKSQPLVVCTLGKDDVIEAFAKLSGRTTHKGITLSVESVELTQADVGERCRVLIVSAKQKLLPELWQELRQNQNTFVIANHSSAAAVPGAMLGFKPSGKRLGLWANLDAINQSQVRLSSQILKIADIQ